VVRQQGFNAWTFDRVVRGFSAVGVAMRRQGFIAWTNRRCGHLSLQRELLCDIVVQGFNAWTLVDVIGR